MNCYISQKTFFHKEQTSWRVSVERLIQATFRKDIFRRKSSITALPFSVLHPSAILFTTAYFPVFLQGSCSAHFHVRCCSEMIFLGFVDGTSSQVSPLWIALDQYKQLRWMGVGLRFWGRYTHTNNTCIGLLWIRQNSTTKKVNELYRNTTVHYRASLH